MGASTQKRGWFIALAVVLVGCSHKPPPPPEMSAEAHRGEAARHELKAQEEQKKSEEKAPTFALPRSSTGTPLSSYSAEHQAHARSAEAERAHAAEHLKAAKDLEKDELDACREVPEQERASCPLLAPQVKTVAEVERGVVLELKPGAPVDELLGDLKCHLAYERRTGFEQRACPLDIPGLVAETGPISNSISLIAGDPNSAQALRASLRELLGGPKP